MLRKIFLATVLAMYLSLFAAPTLSAITQVSYLPGESVAFAQAQPGGDDPFTPLANNAKSWLFTFAGIAAIVSLTACGVLLILAWIFPSLGEMAKLGVPLIIGGYFLVMGATRLVGLATKFFN